MRLVFDAPKGHTLIEGGETIAAGQEFDVPDEERARELLTDPHVSVREAVPGNLKGLSRGELDEIAVEKGLDPSDYDNKQAVIDVLPNSEPEAEGAGPNSEQEN